MRDYLIDAVELLARYGHRLLPDYIFCPDTGLWQPPQGTRSAPTSTHRPLLRRCRHPALPERTASTLGEAALGDHLREARALLHARPDEISPTALPACPHTAKRWVPATPPCLTPNPL